jgi:phage recombination protein Bet
MAQLALHNSNQSFLGNPQIELIKSLYFKGLTEDECSLFLHVCNKSGLDPMLKHIYPVKRNTKQPNGSYKETLTIQTGIDGYRLIAERTGRYAPGRESTFCYDESKRLFSATSYIKKMTADGTWHEISATALFEEYCQKDSKGEPTRFWKAMPHGQLAKCAEALAIRRAFPAQLSGIYTAEEMQQSEVLEEIKQTPEIIAIEEQVGLPIPNDVNIERIEKFIKQTSEQTKISIVDIKKRASVNFDTFLIKFRTWELKNFPSEKLNEEIEKY